MRTRFAPACLALAAFLLPPPAFSDSPGEIAYRLVIPDTTSSRARVEIDLPDLSCPRVFVVPRAVPMGYGERPYDRFVSAVEARSADGRPLEVRRQAGPRWSVEGPVALRRLSYEVDLARMEKEVLSAADASKAREGYVGILGYSVFGFAEGQEGRPIRLSVLAPGGWPVFTTLRPEAPPRPGTTTAEAPDFYALADSQIAAGPKLRVARIPGSPPLDLVLYAEAPTEATLTGRIAREAMDSVVEYFGGAPFGSYTVYLELLAPLDEEHVYGFSMEHLDSGTFFFGVDRALGAGSSEADRERERYNFAHHMVHSWIPKRSYGEGYFPFQWELAPVLDTIWFSEGFAQYAAIAALAARRPDGREYREAKLESRFRKTLAEAPGFLNRMTAVELSRVASTRYSEDFRTGSNSFSRGGLMAAEMDDAIRSKTSGRKSLRDALRFLVTWSGRERRAFRLEELPGLLEQGAGVDVRGVFEKWMRAPEPRRALP
jgi:predicted metalloprotease with PDZ domain